MKEREAGGFIAENSLPLEVPPVSAIGKVSEVCAVEDSGTSVVLAYVRRQQRG